MATLEIKVVNHFSDVFRAIEARVDAWPQHKRDEFARKWYDLCDAGAELSDIRMIDGSLHAYPSQDLIQHCAAHGITLG